jgi:hypothetical protein
MEQKTFKQKHRIILINRDFQFRYTGAAVLVGLVSTLLTSGLILYPLYQFEILRIPRFLPLPILLVMMLAAAFNVGLIAFMGVLITHRIAGPMYSLVRQFRRVEEGRWYGQMKIREGDDMKYVVRNFNAMLEAVHHQGLRDLEELRSVQELLATPELSDAEKVSQSRLALKSLDDKLRDRLHAGTREDGGS